MTEKGKAFLSAASKNETLKKELEGLADINNLEDVLKVAAAHGFDLTAEDLDVPEEEIRELDLDELDGVAGGEGGDCYCIGAGYGEADDIYSGACLCLSNGAGVFKFRGDWIGGCGCGGFGYGG